MAKTHKINIKSNKVKSNPGSTGQEEEVRDLWMAMLPTDLPFYAGHRRAIETRLLAFHSTQIEDVT